MTTPKCSKCTAWTRLTLRGLVCSLTAIQSTLADLGSQLRRDCDEDWRNVASVQKKLQDAQTALSILLDSMVDRKE